MLNVFLLFLNSFLRFLFFLAGLIPQLLQKSQMMGKEVFCSTSEQKLLLFTQM